MVSGPGVEPVLTLVRHVVCFSVVTAPTSLMSDCETLGLTHTHSTVSQATY